MDLPTFAEFQFLQTMHYANMQEFLHIHRLRSDTVLISLMKMFHVIEANNECWQSDMVDIMGEDPKWAVKIAIGAHYMMQGRYIRYGRKDEILGREYQITNKGRALLDQYTSWIREKEMQAYYKMKKTHAKSRELKENS